ncbi:MAG: hypothetical protein FWD69_02540 [Polyangiaceae bacterium]|nr:hypothetical protein [Polyangiaceae bacterium]
MPEAIVDAPVGDDTGAMVAASLVAAGVLVGDEPPPLHPATSGRQTAAVTTASGNVIEAQHMSTVVGSHLANVKVSHRRRTCPSSHAVHEEALASFVTPE